MSQSDRYITRRHSRSPSHHRRSSRKSHRRGSRSRSHERRRSRTRSYSRSNSRERQIQQSRSRRSRSHERRRSRTRSYSRSNSRERQIKRSRSRTHERRRSRTRSYSRSNSRERQIQHSRRSRHSRSPSPKPRHRSHSHDDRSSKRERSPSPHHSSKHNEEREQWVEQQQHTEEYITDLLQQLESEKKKTIQVEKKELKVVPKKPTTPSIGWCGTCFNTVCTHVHHACVKGPNCTHMGRTFGHPWRTGCMFFHSREQIKHARVNRSFRTQPCLHGFGTPRLCMHRCCSYAHSAEEAMCKICKEQGHFFTSCHKFNPQYVPQKV